MHGGYATACRKYCPAPTWRQCWKPGRRRTGSGLPLGWDEIAAQAAPAGLVATLAMRCRHRLLARTDHPARLEHEGHGVGDHVRPGQIGMGGLVEGRRIRAVA